MHALVEIALAEVGIQESGGNNCGPRVREYQQATWLDPGPWPWCAAFTAWVLRQWLITAAGRAFLGKHTHNSWRCKDASAFGWEKWARSRDLQVLSSAALARSADIAIFDFSHIGIVVEDEVQGDPIQTVEGNTNGKGERDSQAGDGVWLKSRARGLIRSYIRLGDRAP